MDIQFVDSFSVNPTIKVIGVGGGGCNATEYMVRAQIDGVEFICANTDRQALDRSQADHIVQLGNQLTKGLGAGANPDIGRRAATEDREDLERLLSGADMVFITAGMGGGTGTGAAPVIAQIARSLGALTVAVVTKPFPFEGKKRNQIAQKGIEELSEHVDSVITIPNEKLLSVLGKNVSLLEAFEEANDVLRHAVEGIANLITKPGLINVDFADVRTVMSEMGHAMMGSGTAEGSDRAAQAADKAISSPLLDSVNLQGARGVLVNVSAGTDLSIAEFEIIGEKVRAFMADDAIVIMGTVIDSGLKDALSVTLVATGLEKEQEAFEIKEAAPIAKAPVEQEAPANQTPVRQPATIAEEQGNDYFDIPTFLRKRPQE